MASLFKAIVNIAVSPFCISCGSRTWEGAAATRARQHFLLEDGVVGSCARGCGSERADTAGPSGTVTADLVGVFGSESSPGTLNSMPGSASKRRNCLAWPNWCRTGQYTKSHPGFRSESDFISRYASRHSCITKRRRTGHVNLLEENGFRWRKSTRGGGRYGAERATAMHAAARAGTRCLRGAKAAMITGKRQIEGPSVQVL